MRKVLFLFIMMLLVTVVVFVPWLLVQWFGSTYWYLSALPLIIVMMYVWVRGFDFV